MMAPSNQPSYRVRSTLRQTMRWHESLGEELVSQLWRDADWLMAQGHPLQDKERCLVVRLDDGPDAVVFKHQNWGGLWKTFCKSLRTPQARQSFFDGNFLAEQGIRTPMPLALVERKLGPFGAHSYLMTEFVGGVSLYRMMRFEQPPTELIDVLADQVARLCARLVELQVSHNDLKPENLLIDAAGKVWLIDLEKMRRHQHRDDAQKRLLEDLNRLMHPRNWCDNPTAGERFRQRLLAEPGIAEAFARHRPARHLLVAAETVEPDRRHCLSVLVVSPQSAAHLRTCVDSFRDVADQIVVCGSDVDDGIREFARKSGSELIAPAFGDDLVALQNRALAAARHPWVLVVGGDERVSPDLAKEIQCTLAPGSQYDAFQIQRRRVYLGHVIKFGEGRKDAPIRLFRNGRGRFQSESDSPRLQVDANKIGRLKSKLMHFLCWQVQEWIGSCDEQTSRIAALRHQRGERPKLIGATFRAARQFARCCFWQHGWLDGKVGLQLSLIAASSVIVEEIKLWELHAARRLHDPAYRKPALGMRLFCRAARDTSERPQLRRAS